MTRSAFAWVLLAALSVSPACGPRAEEAPDVAAASKASDCAFQAPELFRERNVVWEGECSGGKANGLGALRAYAKTGSSDTSVLIFFGRVKAGALELGAIETPDGYIAGPFAEGKAVDSEDRNVIIQAFQVASDAAKLVSQRFKAAGNSASAAFYEERAKRLAEQMD